MAIGGGIGIYYFFSTGSKDGFKDKGQLDVGVSLSFFALLEC